MVRFAVILHNLLGGHLYEYVSTLWSILPFLSCFSIREERLVSRAGIVLPRMCCGCAEDVLMV